MEELRDLKYLPIHDQDETIIVMIRWTSVAPWEFEFPFPGSLTSTFLESNSTSSVTPVVESNTSDLRWAGLVKNYSNAPLKAYSMRTPIQQSHSLTHAGERRDMSARAMGGVSREQKMLKGHLSRVIYHQVY